LVIVVRRGLKDLGRVLQYRTVPLALAIAIPVAELDGAMHLAMMSQYRNHSARWDLHQMVGALETMIATRIIGGRNGSWGGEFKMKFFDGFKNPPHYPPSVISSFFG
jgi:hypothetical protein